jgi:hypothetical protein
MRFPTQEQAAGREAMQMPSGATGRARGRPTSRTVGSRPLSGRAMPEQPTDVPGRFEFRRRRQPDRGVRTDARSGRWLQGLRLKRPQRRAEPKGVKRRRGRARRAQRAAPGSPRMPLAKRSRSSETDWMADLLLYFSAVRGQERCPARSEFGPELGGRYWDRTSDLFGVNEALSR